MTVVAPTLDHTHDAATRSWVASANDGATDFPIQNLPLAVFATGGAARGGVAIGDQVLDLAALAASGLLQGLAAEACRACAGTTLNDYLALGPQAWRALRHGLFALVRDDVDATTRQQLQAMLAPQARVTLHLPARIGDYTDFYTSLHHAINVGKLLFTGDPLTPNFRWLPIAYHGRASSVRLGVEGFGFRRPLGQARAADAAQPAYGPCARLDFELEMGFFIGAGNPLGEPVPLSQAPSQIAGMVLLNDWSARDQQFWEMNPLGPFLGKNFCTTISPWMVTLDALAPFRTAAARPASDPAPLAYLDDAQDRAHGGLDVQLEACVDTPLHRQRALAPSRVTRTSFRHQYWTIGQMLAQHTVGGCNLQPGDLIGTGTVSGPTPEEAGALVELTRGGREPITLAHTGESRTFLEDGDSVVLRGWCERAGFARIGFGECRGAVLPAPPQVGG